MEGITKPSINRLARRAGVKSMSEECYDKARDVISDKLNEIMSTTLIINSEHQTKTLMAEDVYNALHLLGYNITASTDLGTITLSK